MRFFFNADLLDNGFHGGLDTTSIQRQINQPGIVQPSFSAGKNEMWMPVNGPEISQDKQGVFRQRHQSILVAFGITNMNPHVDGVDIAHRQLDPFAKV